MMSQAQIPITNVRLLDSIKQDNEKIQKQAFSVHSA